MAHFFPRFRFLLPALMLAVATPFGLSGCAGFFVCQKASCPASTTNAAASTGDYSYVANSATGTGYINGYSLSGGALTAATGSPYNLGFIPSAMVVSPNDNILFVASSQTANIYAYSIGTGGALTILNNGTAAAGEEVTSMAMSPDGVYLFALDVSGSYLAQYSINYTTGALTQHSLTSFSLTGVTPEAIAVAPSGDFIAVSLGQAGFNVYPYTASTGTVGSSAVTFAGSTTTSYYGMAIDSNNNLYVAETNGVVSIPVSSAGVPSVTSATPTTAGNGPRGVAVSGSFVYVANSLDGKISTYSASSTGVLTGVGTAAISGPATVTALSSDATGKYLLADGYSSSSGLDLYSIATNGTISLIGGQPTSASAVPSALASVH